MPMQTMKAQAYRAGAMGSTGDATYMLITQHQFPDQYHRDDRLISADHDRCLQWDYEHATKVIKKHTGSGEAGIGSWVAHAQPKDVIAFLAELLVTDQNYADVKWTGYRVMGTVHRSNGQSIWTLELFAKNHPNTEVHDTPSIKYVVPWELDSCD